MADDSTFVRRGGKNLLQAPKRELKIRLVYPPDKIDPDSATPASITDRPAKNMDYSLSLKGVKKPIKGTTDGGGMVIVQLKTNAKTGMLTLYTVVNGKKTAFWKIQLEIGDLARVDDLRTSSGLMARLNNLGLFAGKDINENAEVQFFRATERFIALFGVPNPSPAPYGPAARLKEVYGS